MRGRFGQLDEHAFVVHALQVSKSHRVVDPKRTSDDDFRNLLVFHHYCASFQRVKTFKETSLQRSLSSARNDSPILSILLSCHVATSGTALLFRQCLVEVEHDEAEGGPGGVLGGVELLVALGFAYGEEL